MGSNRRMTEPKRKRDRLSSAPRPRPPYRPRSKQSGAFARWVDATPLTAQQVASRLGISIGFLYNVRVGARTPGRSLAVKIEKLTDGMVPVEAW